MRRLQPVAIIVQVYGLSCLYTVFYSDGTPLHYTRSSLKKGDWKFLQQCRLFALGTDASDTECSLWFPAGLTVHELSAPQTMALKVFRSHCFKDLEEVQA